jgi:hypothetical protein
MRHIMNHYQKPTVQQEQAAVEVKTAFAEHLNQFNASCDAVRDIEGNRSAIANEALKSALLSRDQNKIIQTDDGTEWRHDLDLSKISSICHRRIAGQIEFAVVESLSLKHGREMKDILNRGDNVREVLQGFIRDQRQVLRLWKDDLNAQVKEHLAEKYPGQDMSLVADSFEYKMTRAISETYVHAQSQSHGMRV